MLRALARRKTGTLNGADLLQELTAYEDPLTAAVFARLEYLPVGLAWDLVRAASRSWVGADLPQLPPSDEGTWALWPTLWHDDDHPDKEREIPDVLWTLGAADGAGSRTLLIFEAKHGDAQSLTQWRNQLRATASLAGRRWLVAVGGDSVVVVDEEERRALMSDGVAGVLVMSWRDLASDARRLSAAPRYASHERRVLEDLATALRLWGYEAFRPMSELPRYAHGVVLQPVLLPRLSEFDRRARLHPLSPYRVEPGALDAWSFR